MSLLQQYNYLKVILSDNNIYLTILLIICIEQAGSLESDKYHY